jgi:hypothetical protein
MLRLRIDEKSLCHSDCCGVAVRRPTRDACASAVGLCSSGHTSPSAHAGHSTGPRRGVNPARLARARGLRGLTQRLDRPGEGMACAEGYTVALLSYEASNSRSLAPKPRGTRELPRVSSVAPDEESDAVRKSRATQSWTRAECRYRRHAIPASGATCQCQDLWRDQTPRRCRHLAQRR